MRTAEEILEAFSDTSVNWPLNKKQNVIAAMKEYAIEACRKQRKICRNQAIAANKTPCLYIDTDKVLNSPLPELK